MFSRDVLISLTVLRNSCLLFSQYKLLHVQLTSTSDENLSPASKILTLGSKEMLPGSRFGEYDGWSTNSKNSSCILAVSRCVMLMKKYFKSTFFLFKCGHFFLQFSPFKNCLPKMVEPFYQGSNKTCANIFPNL